MEIRLHCECGNEVVVAGKEPGAKVRCLACGRELTVPAPAEPQEASAEPARRFDCPYCFEAINPRARKCPHCQEYLDPALAPAKQPQAPMSALALASLILAVVSPLVCLFPAPLGVLLGFGGLVSTRGGKARGRGMAVAGVLLGLVWTALLALVVVGMVYGAEHGSCVPRFQPSQSGPLF